MELTSYQRLVQKYYLLWNEAIDVIQKQGGEIKTLKEELTEERRECYRLRNELHTLK